MKVVNWGPWMTALHKASKEMTHKGEQTRTESPNGQRNRDLREEVTRQV